MEGDTTFAEGVDYDIIEPEVSYKMVREYSHSWFGPGPIVSEYVVGSTRLAKYVEFIDFGVILRRDYEWNGSNIVVDQPSCMRASAVHDAWCQGMELGILANDEENWDRGVDEYVAICKQDGLNVIRRNVREFFMKLWGEIRRD